MRRYRFDTGRSVLASTTLAMAMMMGQPVPPSHALTIGGPFTLTTPDGATVTDQTFRGKWLLVYFGYTSCPDSCPTALADMSAALAALGPDAVKLQPLFITVDPAHDTPKAVAAYVASFDARIIGLTGTQAAIDAVTQAYGSYAAPHRTDAASRVDRPASGLLDHSVYIYLMNPNGAFVRAFDPTWSGERIASAVHRAMAPAAGDRQAHLRQ